MKEAVAYDAYNNKCMGGIYNDINYINYNSTEWKANATAMNLTAPVDFYWKYIPQKSGDSYKYANEICQSNVTMCDGQGGGGGAIVGAIIGGCCGLICLFILFKKCCNKKKRKKRKEQVETEEVMVEPGKEIEVMAQPEVMIESQTVTSSTTTNMHQAYGPPPGMPMMMPPPPM